ncbi:tegument host shutoff protein [Saimiriine alphaherpesvirus 1]|uniref:Virion host shutoff protein n=1 Tax=Saimiriine herpesvirus 1 (strain MV-5-4-PSL) TaxID=10353 RepID=E2IUC8_SHV1|nr:tegument host shutoff protein [Saimiriine alphaherpesvirus 1]ADO13786.1 tegument host shutoff protein [Saimiriine alphaherpesvirus 1]
MGLFGMMKFAYAHRLVHRQSIRPPAGMVVPVAVDLWNVMYTLVEKYAQRYPAYSDEAITVRCLAHLLGVLAKRRLYPIFVTDRGADCNGRVVYGAKAILARTTAQYGSGEAAGYDDTDAESPLPSPLDYTAPGPDDRRSAYAPGTAFSSIRRRGRPAPRLSQSPGEPAPPLGGAPASTRRPSGGRSSGRLAHQLCMRVVRALGYPYVNSGQMEADDACANLYHTNTVAYVFSTDTDLLLMGCDIILDVGPCFLPTIRCRDVLRYLKMSYPQFLAMFVRCHTDLHPGHTCRSVDDVLQDFNWFSPGSHPEPDPDSGSDSDWSLHISRRSRRRSKKKSIPDHVTESQISWAAILEADAPGAVPDPTEDDEFYEDFQHLCGGFDAQRLDDDAAADADSEESLHASHQRYTITRRRNIIRDATEALDWLPEPQTREDVVERRFVKYVISLITPRQQGSWTLLKRVPVFQDERDVDVVQYAVQRHVAYPEDAEQVLAQLWYTVPAPSPYQSVLDRFWNDSLN